MHDDLNTQFLRGLETIEDAIDLECRARGIHDPMVRHEVKSHQAVFRLQVKGRPVEQRFSREEVRDSSRALNPEIRLVVRALVARGTQARLSNYCTRLAHMSRAGDDSRTKRRPSSDFDWDPSLVACTN